MLMPRQTVPALTVPLVDGTHFDLATEQPEHFTLVVFYRGLHCPICAKYLSELARLLPDFAQRGVTVVAISSDTPERAAKMPAKLGGHPLRIGHSLPLQVARDWGLYLSTSRGTTSIGIEEPPLFSEPGVFLVRPDNTLYFGNVQTMPFARPVFSEMLGAIDFVLANQYPARGEYDGALN